MRYNNWLPYQYLATPLRDINNCLSYQYLATPLKEIKQLAAISIFSYTPKRYTTIGCHINI